MIIRAASSADVPAVHALEGAIFGPEAWSRPSVTSALCGSDMFAVVAGADGAGADGVLGYAVAKRVGAGTDLHRLGVIESCRRQGVASALLAAVVERSRAAGADRMLLEVGSGNGPALAFYGRHGFTQVSRRARYYRDGTDAVVLFRRLSGNDSAGREE